MLRLDALLGIVITGLIFGFVLARLLHLTGLGAWVTTGAVVVLGVVIALVLKALDGRLPAIRR